MDERQCKPQIDHLTESFHFSPLGGRDTDKQTAAPSLPVFA